MEQQVNEKKMKNSLEQKTSRDWCLNPKNEKNTSFVRNRRINETSKQNAMVSLVSPGALIETEQEQACHKCKKKAL